MWWKTHVSAGLVGGVYYLSNLAGTMPCFPTNIISTAAFLGVTTLAAVAVDIDSKDSKIGRLVYPAAAITEEALTHRGPLHSPFIPAVLYIFLCWLAPVLLKTSQIAIWGPMIALPVLIGYVIGHLLPDLFNPAGLPLWPLKVRIAIPVIKPLGMLDKGLCLVLDAWLIVFVLNKWIGLSIPNIIAPFF